MTTSGSSDWTIDGDSVLKQMLKKCGVLSVGRSATSEQLTDAREVLNALIKSMSGKYKMLFKLNEYVIPLAATSVVEGSDGNAYEAIRTHKSSTATEPITGANWQAFWQSSDETTSGLWADATDYQAIGDYILDDDVVGITDARLVEDGKADRYLEVRNNKSEWFNQTNKNSKGDPTALYFFRRRRDIVGGTGTELLNEAILYQIPQDTTKTLILNAFMFSEDIDGSTDNFDFPQEAIDMLIFKGAERLHFNYYALTSTEFQLLKIEAQEAEDNFRGLDEGTGDVYFSPNIEGR